MEASLQGAVAGYYERALSAHGPTAGGVDWPSTESQALRFEVLLAGVDFAEEPSVLDYGCGYGALADFLDARGERCRYVGFDIAPSMIEAARARAAGRAGRTFTTDATELEPCEHVVASGLFNVKLDVPPERWRVHAEQTLERLFALARTRLAFNMLPPPSLPELGRPHLHYAEPQLTVAFCRERLGGTVALRERYGLWEYTVTVTREDPR